MLRVLRSGVHTIHELRISDENRFGARILPNEYSEGSVTGLKASVPIAAVLIKSEPHSSSNRSRVVSDHHPDSHSGGTP